MLSQTHLLLCHYQPWDHNINFKPKNSKLYFLRDDKCKLCDIEKKNAKVSFFLGIDC